MKYLTLFFFYKIVKLDTRRQVTINGLTKWNYEIPVFTCDIHKIQLNGNLIRLHEERT